MNGSLPVNKARTLNSKLIDQFNFSSLQLCDGNVTAARSHGAFNLQIIAKGATAG
jgi:hypothetical protein